MATRKFLYVDANGDYIESAGAFEAADHINVSTGGSDTGKSVVLDSEGKIDPSMISLLSFLDEQYVPFGTLQQTNFEGKKGMWSFSSNKYYKCIATDTWFVVPSETVFDEKITDLIAGFIAGFTDQYVPDALVTSDSSSGSKGQWSFQVGASPDTGYVKLCIATDTWVRFEVDTAF